MKGDLTREEVAQLEHLSDGPEVDAADEPIESGGAPPPDVAFRAMLSRCDQVLESVDPILSRMARRSPGLSSGAPLTELIAARENLSPSVVRDRQPR